MKGNVFASLVSITNGLHRDDRSDREFNFQNSELKERPKADNAVFKVNFKRPLNSKKEYYFKLISNDTETELAALKSEFPTDAGEPESKYRYTRQFNKYDKYLKDIAAYIKKQSISNDLGNDTDYIINYLKVSAIRLYIELQEQYGQFSDTALFSIQEIAEKYFNDTDFDTSVYVKIEADKKGVIKKPSKTKSKPKTSFGYKNKRISLSEVEIFLYNKSLYNINGPIKKIMFSAGENSSLFTYVNQIDINEKKKRWVTPCKINCWF